MQAIGRIGEGCRPNLSPDLFGFKHGNLVKAYQCPSTQQREFETRVRQRGKWVRQRVTDIVHIEFAWHSSRWKQQKTNDTDKRWVGERGRGREVTEKEEAQRRFVLTLILCCFFPIL
jgi:hypothetical protein